MSFECMKTLEQRGRTTWGQGRSRDITPSGRERSWGKRYSERESESAERREDGQGRNEEGRRIPWKVEDKQHEQEKEEEEVVVDGGGGAKVSPQQVWSSLKLVARLHI